MSWCWLQDSIWGSRYVDNTLLEVFAPSILKTKAGILSESAQAAITKHRGRELKPQTFISYGSGAWKSRTRVLADSIAAETLSWACRWPPSHRVLTWWREKELGSLFLFLYGTNSMS